MRSTTRQRQQSLQHAIARVLSMFRVFGLGLRGAARAAGAAAGAGGAAGGAGGAVGGAGGAVGGAKGRWVVYRSTHVGAHDAGSVPVSTIKDEVDKKEVPTEQWEVQTHALLGLVVGKGLMSVDELRANVEALDPEAYSALSYYEKWAYAMTQALVGRGVIDRAAVEVELNPEVGGKSQTLRVGTPVRVKEDSHRMIYSKPHLRSPGYIHNAVGTVEAHWGAFPDPQVAALGISAPDQDLYSIRFRNCVLWELYEGSPEDASVVEVFHEWLTPISSQDLVDAESAAFSRWDEFRKERAAALDPHGHGHAHGHGHGHAHSHGAGCEPHVHETRDVVEANAIAKEFGLDENGDGNEDGDGEGDLSSMAARGRVFQELSSVLVKLLVEEGHITRPELSAKMEAVEGMDATQGARLVAHAWKDPEFKNALLADPDAAAASIGIETSNYGKGAGGTVLRVVANSESVHNLIVCTLCSCYPTQLLGLSPAWYKSLSYRSKAIRSPRALLSEFGVDLPDDIAVNVYDSTADLRYMVLPLPPPGVDVDETSVEDLVQMVGRDDMIGVRRQTL